MARMLATKRSAAFAARHQGRFGRDLPVVQPRQREFPVAKQTVETNNFVKEFEFAKREVPAIQKNDPRFISTLTTQLTQLSTPIQNLDNRTLDKEALRRIIEGVDASCAFEDTDDEYNDDNFPIASQYKNQPLTQLSSPATANPTTPTGPQNQNNFGLDKEALRRIIEGAEANCVIEESEYDEDSYVNRGMAGMVLA